MKTKIGNTKIGALTAVLATATALSATDVAAQDTCGGFYTVQRGDSLSLIADRMYKDVSQWTVIYRSNIDKIGTPDSIRVGQEYRLPCIDGLPVGLRGGKPVDSGTPEVVARAAAPLLNTPQQPEDRSAQARARTEGVDVRLLAGDDFKPFTNRLQMNSGLISNIVNRAFVATDAVGLHKFYWVNDRSVHLDPMLSEGMVDLAFPWRKPDCDGDAASLSICTDYVYSDAMFEMLVVLFTAKGSGVTYSGEEDLPGMRVCSPLGHSSARFGQGVSYLSRVGARLQQPEKAEECFARLVAGTVDAVAMNEFTGRVALKDMGLSDRVELQLSRPLAIEGLHAVAHRSNPRAEEFVAALNDGLATMRDSGEYLDVIDRHMSSIWAGL